MIKSKIVWYFQSNSKQIRFNFNKFEKFVVVKFWCQLDFEVRQALINSSAVMVPVLPTSRIAKSQST